MNTQTEKFFKAVGQGRVEEVAALIPSVDVNAVDPSGKTALIWAAHKGQDKVVEALVQAGADVNKAESQHGVTALMLAVHQGYDDVVAVLLTADCSDCYRAMFLAAKRGHHDILKRLKVYASRKFELV